jgi:hypothetical protein
MANESETTRLPDLTYPGVPNAPPFSSSPAELIPRLSCDMRHLKIQRMIFKTLFVAESFESFEERMQSPQMISSMGVQNSVTFCSCLKKGRNLRKQNYCYFFKANLINVRQHFRNGLAAQSCSFQEYSLTDLGTEIFPDGTQQVPDFNTGSPQVLRTKSIA